MCGWGFLHGVASLGIHHTYANAMATREQRRPALPPPADAVHAPSAAGSSPGW